MLNIPRAPRIKQAGRSFARLTTTRRAPAGIVLTAVVAAVITLTTAAWGEFNGALFRSPHNITRSPSATSLARTSPRSLILDANGKAFVFYMERINHTAGVTRELAMTAYRPGTGWDSLATPIAWWDGTPSTDPTCAIDWGHAVHLVWTDRQGGKPQVYGQVFKLEQGLWSDPLQLSEGTAPTADPALAVGPDGWIHVAWAEIVGSTSIVRHRCAEPGGHWLEIDAPAIHPGHAAYAPDLLVDSTGQVHLTWESSVSSGVGIGHATWNRADGWSAGELVTAPVTAVFAQTPVLAVAPDQSLYVAWANLDPDGSSSLHLRRRLRGGHWQLPQVIASNAVEIVAPAIAVDMWGTAHLLWQEAITADDYNEPPVMIMYFAAGQRRPDQLPPRSLTSSNSGPNRTPMLAVDSSGRIAAAWVDDGAGLGDLFCRMGVTGFARADR